MKQILLVFSLCFFIVAANGTNKKNVKPKAVAKINVLDNALGADVVNPQKKVPVTIIKGVNLKAPVGDVVGTTTYDLQTNTGVCRRVATHPSGRWTYFGWTQGKDYSNAAPNRGTGFNFYDRNSGAFQAQPNARIEPVTRVGWPTIGFNQGRQFSITHTGANGMMFAWRPGNAELNDWNEVIVGDLVSDPDGVWARAAASGSNIYAVIGRQYTSNPFGNTLGGLNFIRSQDNGNTWESLGSLEPDYSNTFPFNMTADSYQIDAAGDKVAVVFGAYLTQVVLYSSDDAGDNWTKTIVQGMDNPLAKDKDPDPDVMDYSIDPSFGSDGGNAIIIDNSGKTHVVFTSEIQYNPFDNDHAAAGDAFILIGRPSTMFYWNEDMAAPVNVGKANLNDNNGDGVLGSLLFESENTGREVLGRYPFYSNLIAQPQLGIDEDDNLYLSYSAIVDGDFVPDSVEFTTKLAPGDPDTTLTANFPSNLISYHDVFMLKSTDGGASWQGPLNVTDAADSEEVYPSIARDIKDTIFLLYQHDVLPGTLLQGPQGNATVNEMAVVKILPDDISDAAAAADSEPLLFTPFTEFTLPVNCGIDKDIFLRENSWGLDYPEGLLTSDIKIWEGDGVPDFSIPDTTLTVGVYVEDSAGNKSDTIQLSVTMVSDDVAPVIEIDNECTEFDLLVGSEWATPDVRLIDLVEFTSEGVTSIEDSGCDISENLTVEDNVDPSAVGAYEVIYSVSDFSGNDTTLVLNVNVIEVDDIGPVVEAVNVPEEIALGLPVNTDAWAFIARDNVDCTNVTVEIEGLDDIDSEAIGEYIITVIATDQSNNTTTTEFTVSVVDRDEPEIEFNGPATIEVESTECGDDGIFDAADDPGFTATDEVDGDITANVVATYNYGDGIPCSCGNDGQYFIDYTVTDAAGNETSAEREVIVLLCVGIEENPIFNLVDIFPNPTKGMLTVQTQNLVVNEITVYNVIGKNVLSLTQNELRATNKLDLNNQPEGIYMVNINTNEGAITKKVTISRK